MTRKAVETGALWKPWKNGDIKQTTLGVEFFHRSHNAWKTPPDGVSHSSHRFYDEIHQPKNETQDFKSVTYVPGRNCYL